MLTAFQRLQKFLRIVAVVLFGSSAASMALAQSVPMLVQAEAMSTAGSSAPMATGNDIAAMGGRFIGAPSGAATTMSPVRGASVQVNVPAGTYFLWARIAGPTSTSDALYVGIDASFARVFPTSAPSGSYEWVKVATVDGGTSFGFSLSGTHTIQVGYGEVGAKLDAVYLTANSADVPNFTAPAKLLVEAESLNRIAPMTVASEDTALGGQYLTPSSGTDSTTPVREASVAVDVPAGTYFLWARITGPTTTNDALYVGIDSSFARVFPQTQPSGTYEWVKVPTTNGGSTFGFTLSSGAHVLQVGHGEIGAKLDALYVTTDSSEVPSFAPMRRVIEAESFNLQTTPPTMVVGTDATANGAQYLTTTATTNSTTPVREAWTTVTAPVAGTYYLWARVAGADINSDAVYAGFDNTFIRVFPQTSNGAYEWIRVEATPGSVNGFTLSAGAHDIQVGHGEVGARIDAVYVTDNATDTPTGASTPPLGPCVNPSGGYEGFGRSTTGGAGQPIFHVTNLNDSGAGSLRDALSVGNRCIVFDVGGTINLNNELNVRSNVTIDGFTAPAPGITLRNITPPGPDENSNPSALVIYGNNGTGNVVVRGLRVRLSPGDGISITTFGGNGQIRNIVLDHVSVSGAADGAIDVTGDVQNVTIQWSILGPEHPDPAFQPLKSTLISAAPDASGNLHGATRVTVHHDLYFHGEFRSPRCAYDATLPAPAIVCDIRNNLIWNYTGDGTQIDLSARANVISNYYWTDGRPDHNGNPPADWNTIVLKDAASKAYVSGNFSQNGFNLNDNGNTGTAFPVDAADTPVTTEPRTAAIAVRGTATGKEGAGARGPNFELDQVDKDIINGVSIP